MVSLEDVVRALPPTSRLAAALHAGLRSPIVSVHPAVVGLLARILIAPKTAIKDGVVAITTPTFETCEAAFIEHRVLRIEYVDARGIATERVIEPHGFLLRANGWSIVARDRTRTSVRTFRLDRIRKATVEATRFVPVDPRDL